MWADIDQGSFSTALTTEVLKFNGKLFKQPSADGFSLLLNQALNVSLQADAGGQIKVRQLLQVHPLRL